MLVERDHGGQVSIGKFQKFCIQKTVVNPEPLEFALKVAVFCIRSKGAVLAEIITIPRQVLHQEVATRLRQRIVEGAIAPGAKLNERELSESLHVSRTPLREAIKMLAAEGLVELLPNRGAVAASLGEQDVADTFEVIAGLEGQSGELAAQRITDAELAEIRALHYEMLAAFTRRDLSTYYRLNAQIHTLINAAARNPVLTQTWRNVNARLQALRFRSNFDEAKWQRAVHEHERMVELLAARDGPALRALLAQHLDHKRDAVLELMRAGTLHGAASA
jgi:DNA-binding GntR family transcriptional regulator